MYSENFKAAVDYARRRSQPYVTGKMPNPYYVGFGNPGSEIIIFGKEQAFDGKNEDQILCESSKNPDEWWDVVRRQFVLDPNEVKPAERNYYNCQYPYSFKMKPGHTWSKYQKLLNYIQNSINSFPNEFLFESFISEVNFRPSRLSPGIPRNNCERSEFLNQEFFKDFKINIFACGDYVDENHLRAMFSHVDLVKSIVSEKSPKLIVYANQSQILVHTRQLSMNVRNALLEKISEIIKLFRTGQVRFS